MNYKKGFGKFVKRQNDKSLDKQISGDIDIWVNRQIEQSQIVILVNSQIKKLIDRYMRYRCKRLDLYNVQIGCCNGRYMDEQNERKICKERGRLVDYLVDELVDQYIERLL